MLERDIGNGQITADDRAGDDHDDGALHQLLAPRPLDLFQLGYGLAEEAERTVPALLRDFGLLRAKRRIPRRTSLLGERRLGLPGTASAALLTGWASHRLVPASGSPDAGCASRTNGSTC